MTGGYEIGVGGIPRAGSSCSRQRVLGSNPTPSVTPGEKYADPHHIQLPHTSQDAGGDAMSSITA